MSDVLITNVGVLVTGDVENPRSNAESVYVADGVVREVDATTTTAETVVDARGATLAPGLIDSHVHPVFGDYTPRQRTLGWCESYLHGGITSMISNGEPHLPGRPPDVESAKALATLAHKSFERERPGGVKLRGGTLILGDGMTEDDIEDVHREGVERLKFLMPVEDRSLGRDLVRWGHDRDMVVLMHCGGTSLPGVESTDAELFVDIQPDIAAHTNGGPTPVPDEEVRKLVTETDLVLDLVLAGNQRVAVDILQLAADRDDLHRVQLGTDTPSGTGVTPLGVLLEAAILASMTDVPPAEILCLASGTTATHHGLDTGRIEPGRPADLVLLDAPKGGPRDDALATLAHGEYPAVDKVWVDGELLVERSRNTAPAKTPAEVL
ncbi:amidohydrolase family protein [Salinigranum salinum]|uniref:amidohydrolase family protein n=1 Tax=Salinigranum salinum TaxID=1364937 RepID=UPI0012607462|nr:amidohydrolase family protein [Salinigranum salinum]